MEMHVVASTADYYKVQFSDSASGLNLIVGISTPLINLWELHTDQLLPTITVLADEILMNHDPAKPLPPEIIFSSLNASNTLDGTVDMIRKNPF